MAGAGYKLFNTGDVLTAAQVNTYLMEQTIMVFANATARDTALSGVLAQGMQCFLKDTNTMQYYSGAAWTTLSTGGDITSVVAGTGISGGGTSGDVTITNSMATTIDAKGDLIAGTADNTFARLAVGSNGDTLVADSAATTGLRWQSNFAAGKNKFINGDFGIWQRGTSSTTNGTFLADRWYFAADGTGSTNTVSQQTFTAGTAPVAGYEGTYFWRLSRSAAGSGNTYNILEQKIEDVRTFAGQTVTLSYWAKADASRTTSATTLYQNFGSGGSTQVATTISASQSLTTSWTRFSTTFSVPSISGKTIGTSSYIAIDIGLCSNAAATTDIWGVQLEAGSVATAFQTATGTLAGELAACQRYYYRTALSNASNSSALGTSAGTYSTTEADCIMRLPVTMRTVPSSIDSANLAFRNYATNTYNMSSVVLFASGTSPDIVYFYGTIAGGPAANTPGYIWASGANGYVGFSAEL